ncbi:MAG: S8 family serine peptidase, partial [Deltaproteobacteria bacterium]|nr:S8 family serine peptidase [Deltaproteobacteria bacterium]
MKTVLGWMAAILALTLALVLTGCAKDRGGSGEGAHWVQAAPASASQVGFLVAAGPSAGAKVESLLESSGGKARVLDAAEGRYEIFGVSQESIVAALPGAEVRKNHYYDHLIQDAPAVPAVDPWLLDCKKAEFPILAPVVAVKALTHARELGGSTRTVKFGDASMWFSLEGVGNEYLWQVLGPRGFHVEGKSATIAFNATLPGEYIVDIIAKNAPKNCAETKFDFQVTWKQPYLGRKLPLLVRAEDFKQISHLSAVGATTAWSKSFGDNVKIAIVDSGVNYNHPDLAPNMADELGWDFVNGDNMPFDDNEHGTHVAGLAAGARYGVAPHARILAVKALNAAGGGDVGSIEQGIRYAVNQRSNVIVMSLGRYDDSFRTQLEPAIAYAESHNVLV